MRQMRDENSRLVSRYFEMWNSGDVSIADEVLAPTWADHAHPEVNGPPDVKTSVTTVRRSRPDLQFTIESVLTGDDGLVAAVGTVGRQASDRPGADRMIWLIRVNDGRMAEMWTFRQPPVP
jgi:ketosteroid isomerase-like protein